MSVETEAGGRSFIRCQCSPLNEWQPKNQLDKKEITIKGPKILWKCPKCKRSYNVGLQQTQVKERKERQPRITKK